MQLIGDKYEIVKRLAVGGMGEIFLARQRGFAGFDRLAIVKTLLPDLADQEGFIDQFLDEARVAATLNHPNIVCIYEVGLWEGLHYIAMEYINGESIARIKAAARKLNKGIPMPIAVRIVHDAALGLDYAHHAKDPEGRLLNVVHRDVTPHNIMVSTSGVTKVVDFGVARASNRSTRTTTGTIKGKVPYMPPEQLSNGELDGRTDQWALGVVLWEMLTGERLFKADTDVAAIQHILHGPIHPPSKVAPSVPPELDAVVMRMLSRKITARFGRLQDVAAQLRSYLESVSRQSSETEVSAFVTKIAGSGIDERVQDLTPVSQNYLVSMKGSGTGSHGSSAVKAAPARKSGALVGALVGVALLGLVGGGAAILRPWEQKVDPAAVPVADPNPVKPVKPKLPDPEPDPIPKPDKNPQPDPDPTVLVLSSDPAGAKVYSGERLLGLTPLRISTLSPETDYQLVVEKPGYEPGIVPVRLEKGATKELAVPLAKKAAATPRPNPQPNPNVRQPGPGPGQATPASSEDGYLTLKTVPWTQVTIGGAPYGVTPVFKIKLAPGKHSVTLVNEAAGIKEQRVVEIKPGELTKAEFTLK
ncbi:MAG TPA: protein kinase [Myxococcales bacterium]|jgi:serine/threonine protein kinase